MTFFSFLFKKRFPDASARASLLAGPLTMPKLIALICAGAVIVVLYVLIITINTKFLVTVPARGGSLTEGIIGAPRAIDPLAAVTDTDHALTTLVYAGLMKELPDGTITPDLAKEYSISPDGRSYTFLLREDLRFSDNTPLTATDVAATIETLQNPVVNPRSSAYWQQVAVSTPDANTVIATLIAPDDEFPKRMTIGILSDLQLRSEEAPETLVGAGPFILSDISYESGAPKRLRFERNRHYTHATPLLKSLEVVVYANQENLLAALEKGDIDVTFALAPETLHPGILPDNATFTPIATTRTVALWDLPNSQLASESLRAILNRFVDKKSIVGTIENGYGIVPPEVSTPLSLDEAHLALEKAGYVLKNGTLARQQTPVTISIATVNDPHFLATAQALSQSFTSLGAITQVLGFDRGTLADELAAQTLPIVLSDGTLTLPGSYDIALPLYTSAIVVAADEKAHGITPEIMITPTLRYATVTGWHARTDRVWPFLTRVR